MDTAMMFDLTFPSQNPGISPLGLRSGEILFVLGANGTGKSALMFHFAQKNRKREKRVKKILAHRQMWMKSNKLDMNPSDKADNENFILRRDMEPESRHQDDWASKRVSLTISDLIGFENNLARDTRKILKSGDMEAALRVARSESPIDIINGLFLQSNIPIKVTIAEDDCIMASKDGGPFYSAAELSDGERNALMIAADVLTAPPDTLLLIDEPERHLHRSVISPLLGQLIKKRLDCGFVVATHDLDLPLEVPDARALILRSCHFNGDGAQSWEADELPPDMPFEDNILKRDLLGARRKILFVEGTEGSLDKPLYNLIFPMASVIPRGSRRDVERSVTGSQTVERFNWLRAFGIVYGDRFPPEQIREKREMGIYALPFYSLEALYFHPKIIELIAEQRAEYLNHHAQEIFRKALNSGIREIARYMERISCEMARRIAHDSIMEQLPDDEQISKGMPIKFIYNAPNVQDEIKTRLDAIVQSGDWEAILKICPILESGAGAEISKALGLRREDYRKAVRQLLTNNADAMTFVRGLFDKHLFDQLNG